MSPSCHLILVLFWSRHRSARVLYAVVALWVCCVKEATLSQSNVWKPEGDPLLSYGPLEC